MTRIGKHYRRGPHRLSSHEVERLVKLGEMVEKRRELVEKRRARVNSFCDKFREDLQALLNEQVNEDGDGYAMTRQMIGTSCGFQVWMLNNLALMGK